MRKGENLNMTRESFVFYKSFYEATKDLDPVDYNSAMRAVIEYALNGVQPKNLTPIAKVIFTLIKPQIDANNKRYINGCKGGEFGHLGAEYGHLGGRPRKSPQKPPIKPPNENDNENGNGNDNGNAQKPTRRGTKFSNFTERDVDYNQVAASIIQSQTPLTVIRGQV